MVERHAGVPRVKSGLLYPIAGVDQDGLFHHETVLVEDGLWAERVHGSRKRPTLFGASVEPGHYYLIANTAGTLLAFQNDDAERTVVPPRGLLLATRPTELHLQASRGQHDRLVVKWYESESSALHRWISKAMDRRTDPLPGTIVLSCTKHSQSGSAFDRIESASRLPQNLVAPQLLGAIHELVGMALTQRREFRLTYMPPELPESVELLMRKVQEEPQASWSLKEAASLAGYSPFHLSRTFRTLIGYGFPEFVDRCRTELAVKLLIESDLPVETIASMCGFGSTQGLRDSFREYLGLLPSELRVSPLDEPEPAMR